MPVRNLPSINGNYTNESLQKGVSHRLYFSLRTPVAVWQRKASRRPGTVRKGAKGRRDSVRSRFRIDQFIPYVILGHLSPSIGGHPPTGCFAALQTVQHPKLLAPLTGTRYPLASISILPGQGILQNVMEDPSWPKVEDEDRLLTIALVGLGPVGIVSAALHTIS